MTGANASAVVHNTNNASPQKRSAHLYFINFVMNYAHQYCIELNRLPPAMMMLKKQHGLISDEMQMLLDGKKKLEKTIMSIENEIYIAEQEYLDTTQHGNLIKGWEGLMDSKGPLQSRASTTSTTESLADHRLFSNSSSDYHLSRSSSSSRQDEDGSRKARPSSSSSHKERKSKKRKKDLDAITIDLTP